MAWLDCCLTSWPFLIAGPCSGRLFNATGLASTMSGPTGNAGAGAGGNFNSNAATSSSPAGVVPPTVSSVPVPTVPSAGSGAAPAAAPATGGATGSSGSTGQMSNQNLNQIVSLLFFYVVLVCAQAQALHVGSATPLEVFYSCSQAFTSLFFIHCALECQDGSAFGIGQQFLKWNFPRSVGKAQPLP